MKREDDELYRQVSLTWSVFCRRTITRSVNTLVDCLELSAGKRVNVFFLFIHYLQLGRQPVAGVVTCYISTDCEDFTLKFRYGGLHVKRVVSSEWNDHNSMLFSCQHPTWRGIFLFYFFLFFFLLLLLLLLHLTPQFYMRFSLLHQIILGFSHFDDLVLIS